MNPNAVPTVNGNPPLVIRSRVKNPAAVVGGPRRTNRAPENRQPGSKQRNAQASAYGKQLRKKKHNPSFAQHNALPQAARDRAEANRRQEFYNNNPVANANAPSLNAPIFSAATVNTANVNTLSLNAASLAATQPVPSQGSPTQEQQQSLTPPTSNPAVAISKSHNAIVLPKTGAANPLLLFALDVDGSSSEGEDFNYK